MGQTKFTPYLRKGLFALGFILFVTLMVILNQRHQGQICEVVRIEIDAPFDRALLTQDFIKNKLEEWYPGGLSGTPKSEINLNEIEENIREIPAVRQVEVSFNVNGEVLIDIEQQVPIVRIYNGTQSFYLSTDYVKIPVKGTNPARVPIANGILSNEMTKKVHTLARHVNENAFMEALVEQIFVDDNDLIIIPKIENQKIVIGDTMDIQEKFDKLSKFYKNGLQNVGFDTYRVINLKYKGQVVCN